LNIEATIATIYMGAQTLKQNVLDYASLMEELFDYVAVFYHGHAGRINLDGVLHWDFLTMRAHKLLIT
jgi:hypothetical protein